MPEHVRPTIAQQKELLAECDLCRRNGERCNERSVGGWAGRFFKINRALPQSTASRIVKMHNKIC